MAIRRIVFASGNKGKIAEVAALFAGQDMEIVAQGELGIEAAAETGSTFVENALLKAHHAAFASGLPAIADDSGLSVEALDGRPGVYSARFAGEGASDQQNIDKLLEELQGVAQEQRGAAFHCAAVYVEPYSSDAVIAEGVWPGLILQSREGSGGFGYDPVFFDPQAQKSAATMTAAEKNGTSHRGRAFRQLEELLRQKVDEA